MILSLKAIRIGSGATWRETGLGRGLCWWPRRELRTVPKLLSRSSEFRLFFLRLSTLTVCVVERDPKALSRRSTPPTTVTFPPSFFKPGSYQDPEN